ncbi:hypothetical protein CEXT_345091 [Caerostris extrusa]|uniref:Secreted protein n=1 Tax=Caerostris extrusa TaxID=172846 RepID=A0AAV4SFB1_CAEEX|nr:hypothetical protein CEXT_345091 [Caerostris extrusa]
MHFGLLCMCICAFYWLQWNLKAKLDYETRFGLAQAHAERVLWKVICGVPQPQVVHIETTKMRAVPLPPLYTAVENLQAVVILPMRSVLPSKRKKR